jgi:endonuclease YncB( thermonuclease family)
VNAELIKQGAAWVYRQYRQAPLLLALEAEAKRLFGHPYLKPGAPA